VTVPSKAGDDPRRTPQWRRVRAQIIAASRICGLCGRPLCPDAPPRTRWSTTVDHRIPLRMGGAPFDTANLRAAHLRCNVMAENRSRRGGNGRHGGPRRGQPVRQPQPWQSRQW
jgi:5-methylcytosine-specific restriction endonuclease McrA